MATKIPSSKRQRYQLGFWFTLVRPRVNRQPHWYQCKMPKVLGDGGRGGQLLNIIEGPPKLKGKLWADYKPHKLAPKI
jgi:hypothetical protein